MTRQPAPKQNPIARIAMNAATVLAVSAIFAFKTVGGPLNAPTETVAANTAGAAVQATLIVAR